MSQHEPSFTGPLRCARCGEVIGVYEPLVLVSGDDTTRVTSRAAEPGVGADDGVGYHVACHEPPPSIGADRP